MQGDEGLTVESELQLLLRELPGSEAQSFLKVGRWQDVPKGHVFFRQGDPLEAVYLLDAGKAKIYHATSGGQQALAHLVRPGSIFGSWLTLSSAPKHVAFAQARKNSRVLTWDQSLMVGWVQHTSPDGFEFPWYRCPAIARAAA